MRLVVNRALPKQGDEEPAPRPAGARPPLRVLQGGLARPRRLGASAPATPAPERPQAEPVLRIEEIPIYLRPIPAWVPRLW